MDQALASRREARGQDTIHVRIEEPASLPHRWLGYAGCSLVILPGSQDGLAAALRPEQVEALERWVRMGGRVLICAGESAETSLADGAPLARFLPGKFERTTLQRQTSGLENYAGTSQSLSQFVPQGEFSFRLPVAVILEPRGVIEATEGIGSEQTATIVRASHGFGQVIFVAVDLDQPPVSQWSDGRPKLMARLLHLALGPVVKDEVDRPFGDLSQIGFDDLAGQLRGALEKFPGVRLVPFSWIALLIAVYVLLIGPVDYFLLRKWNKRFGWTWFTFPLWVTAGCALAIALTNDWKGKQTRINQVDLVDVEMQSGFVRGLSWSHLYSPRNAKYDLSLRPAEGQLFLHGPKGSLLSWQGLPGKSFGGMNTTRRGQAGLRYDLRNDLTVAEDQECSIVGMPVGVYSSRSLLGQFWGQVNYQQPEPLVADVENQLRGTVTNPLKVELRDCMVCFHRWVYPLPSLGPGKSAEIDRYSKVRTIDGLLTRSAVDQDFKDRSEPWDRLNPDIQRIMEVMMFHEAAGGTDYTSLLHRFQREVDMSDHLRQGPALLVGRSESPACEVEIEQTGDVVRQQVTYYRVMLPVNSAER